jgi:hypothetical protein
LLLRWLLIAVATRASSAFACGLGANSQLKSPPLEFVCGSAPSTLRRRLLAHTTQQCGGFPGRATK